MSNVMANIKGFDFKGFFLRHGEKIGIGMTGLIVLACLALTNFSSTFQQTPQEILSKAEQMGKQLVSNPWPAAKRDEFAPKSADSAVASVAAPVEVASYQQTIPFSPKLYAYRQPAEEPVVVPVADLRARSGVLATLVAVPPPEDETTDEFAANRAGFGGLEPGDESPPPTARMPRPTRPAMNTGRGVEPRAAVAAVGPGDEVIGPPARMPARAPAARNAPAGRAAVAAVGPGDEIIGPPPPRATRSKSGVLPTAQSDDPSLDYGTMAGGETAKARGMRFNAVTGWVNLRKQYEMLMKSLHVESTADAAMALEYIDFKIQRQRAVPGPVPFPEGPEAEKTWKDVNREATFTILEEVDYDPDVVAPQYINDAFTSPLPARLDREWSAAEVGHPKIPALDEEGRRMELLTNQVAATLAEEAGEEEEDEQEAQFRRGFRRVQKDPNQLRMRAMTIANDPARLNAAMGRMPGLRQGPQARKPMAMPQMPRFSNEFDNDESPFAGMLATAVTRISKKNLMGAAPPPAARPPVANMAPRAAAPAPVGQYAPITTSADMLLFRYLDFDVEPGECYRYRVQLVIFNPSYEEEFVASPDVAAGFDRSSEWSKPSPPVIVPKDVAYTLARASTKQGRRDGADLKVVQLNTDSGTMVADVLKPHFGQYLAETKKTKHLRLDQQTLEDEDVTFTSKEILVDSAVAPTLGNAALQDLRLNTAQLRKLREQGGLDQAVTLSRFGEMIPLDSTDPPDYRMARRIYEEQMEEYKELKDADAAIARQGGFDTRGRSTVDPNAMRGMPGYFRTNNAIKRNQSSLSTGAGGARTPGRRQPQEY